MNGNIIVVQTTSAGGGASPLKVFEGVLGVLFPKSPPKNYWFVKTTRLAGGSIEAFAVEQSRRSGRLPCVRGAVSEAD